MSGVLLVELSESSESDELDVTILEELLALRGFV